MKTLPPNPEPYKRPKERWFEIHKHPMNENGKCDLGLSALTRTLTAMWLMLHDRTFRELPKKAKIQSASEKDSLCAMLKHEGDVMLYWGNLCNKVDPDEPIEKSWQKLHNVKKRTKRLYQ